MPYGTYLTRSRHHTNWYARIVIPHDLRHAYGQRREIRKTLDTPCKVTARRRAMTLRLVFQEVFESLRNGLLVDNISPHLGALAFLTPASPPDNPMSAPPAAEPRTQITRITPLTAVDRRGERRIVSFVKVNPVTGDIVFDSPTEAELKGAERLVKAWRQSGPQAIPNVAPEIPLAAPEPVQLTPESQSLSVLFDQFVSERLADAREKSKKTMRQHLNVFIELMEHLPVARQSPYLSA